MLKQSILETKNALKQKLEALKLEGEIHDDSETLEKYSHDASLFEVRPAVVVSPKNVEDLKKLIKFCTAEKAKGENISLTPRSAGTDMSGGPLSESIILDFMTHFNHVLEVGEGYAVTEPGVYYRDFEKMTLAKGWLLPTYPASRDLCAIGGIVSNNSAGEKTLTYGKTEDYVEELHMILEDGEEHVIKPLTAAELKAKCAQKDFEGEFYSKISKLLEDNHDLIHVAKPAVSKNSAGYYLWNVWDGKREVFNLCKLIVGSQGTLGIVTRVKFRLVRPAEQSKMLVIFMNNLNNLAQIVNAVLAHKPESFESYDDKTLKLAIRFFPEMLKRMKAGIFKLGWEFLPEVGMVLSGGGLPKLVLMAEFTGSDLAEISARAEKTKADLEKFGLKMRIYDHAGSQKYWTIRRESFSLLRNHVHGTRTAPFIDDICVRPEFLPEFLPKLNKILAQYNLIYTIAGHVGNGNFHIIPLMDFKDPKTKEIIDHLSKQVYALVVSYHGSITAEHNDGLIRTPFLEMMYGKKVIKLFEQVKQAFDPYGIFNPGKKVGASWKYALEHVVKTS